MNKKRDQLKQEITNLLGDDGILLFPSFPATAPYHNQANDFSTNFFKLSFKIRSMYFGFRMFTVRNLI